MLFSDLEVVCHKRFLSTNPNMSIKQYRPVKAAETADEGRSVQHDILVSTQRIGKLLNFVTDL